ncbi:hypothetical protein FOZ60_009406 [Perkinsus olseni]|uniref:Uncharacterized protein n=1 Tax=Perkinsus olseni TaxID=32597 RepID=A0A7J6PDX1_PEROL|nr:hypothetical protein FOZ60_009406 [Perkinsus olseni]
MDSTVYTHPYDCNCDQCLSPSCRPKPRVITFDRPTPRQCMRARAVIACWIALFVVYFLVHRHLVAVDSQHQPPLQF